MNTKILRTRFIPEFTDKIETIDFVCYINKDKLTAICYVGKSTKPAFNFRFRNYNHLENYVLPKLLNYTKNFESDRIKKAKVKELNQNFKVQDVFKIGDIVLNSWGYDQTNIEFYQITGFKGTKQITVREISQKYEYSEGMSSMSANTMPKKDDFISDAKEFTLTCKACSWGDGWHICGKESYHYFHKWDGSPKYVSWYA